MEYTEGLPTSEIFRKWSAIAAVTGALERRAYVRLAGKPIYPNMFILLMGRPGTGKSVAIDEVRDLWASTGKFNVAPDRVTNRGLMGTMSRGVRHLGQGEIYTTTLVGSSEFGVLVNTHDLQFMSILNQFYDCLNRPFEDETGQYGHVKLEAPHLSLISGAQPKFFAEVMPDVAYELGFTSRLVMVYSAEVTKVELFPSQSLKEQIHEERAELRQALTRDLRTMATIKGEFAWEAEAAEALDSWYKDDLSPAPDHPNLQNYNARRIMQISKLCQAFSVSRAQDKIITLSDFTQAKAELLLCEEVMPQIFTEISKSTHGDEIRELFEYMWQRYMKLNGKNEPARKPIPQHHMMAFLRTRIPARDIPYTINHMEMSGMIEKLTDGDDGRLITWKPLGREEQDSIH